MRDLELQTQSIAFSVSAATRDGLFQQMQRSGAADLHEFILQALDHSLTLWGLPTIDLNLSCGKTTGPVAKIDEKGQSCRLVYNVELMIVACSFEGMQQQVLENGDDPLQWINDVVDLYQKTMFQRSAAVGHQASLSLVPH